MPLDYFRLLGKSGLRVSPLCLGTMTFGEEWGWGSNKDESRRVFDAYVSRGGNFIDTANFYTQGTSETFIGEFVKGRRDQLVLATKYTLVSREGDPNASGNHRKNLHQALEASLKRLQTDYIDLYQSHTDDSETPLEETLETYAQLIRQGKVRAIGASNYTADRLTQALEVGTRPGYPSYQCLQPLYNLYDRADYETELEPLCLEKGVGVIPYFSLASGFLTGKYRSEKDLANRPRGEMVKKYLNERGFRILDALEQVASQYHSAPAIVSLAWLIARPSITAPIASATSLDQLTDLIEATKLALDPSSIELLNLASA